MTLTLWLTMAYRKPADAQSDIGLFQGPNNIYQYAFVLKENEPAEIQIYYDISNPEEVEKYRAANLTRGKLLAEAASGERLYIVITFTHPLSTKEMADLLELVGFEAVSYTQVGWTATGERMISGIFADAYPDLGLEEIVQKRDEVVLPEGAPDAGSNMAGFMLVDGYIRLTPDSLGTLLKDERVYMADTTSYEVQNLVGVKEAVVHMPTPYAYLDWGDIKKDN